jgi:hypothetical protein
MHDFINHNPKITKINFRRLNYYEMCNLDLEEFLRNLRPESDHSKVG